MNPPKTLNANLIFAKQSIQNKSALINTFSKVSIFRQNVSSVSIRKTSISISSKQVNLNLQTTKGKISIYIKSKAISIYKISSYIKKISYLYPPGLGLGSSGSTTPPISIIGQTY
jgi:hypothetical protein